MPPQRRFGRIALEKWKDLSSSTGTRSTSKRNETGGILQPLPVSSWAREQAVPGSSPEINISDLIKSLSHVQPLTQHLGRYTQDANLA